MSRDPQNDSFATSAVKNATFFPMRLRRIDHECKTTAAESIYQIMLIRPSIRPSATASSSALGKLSRVGWKRDTP
jgi:hypothetical protein